MPGRRRGDHKTKMIEGEVRAPYRPESKPGKKRTGKTQYATGRVSMRVKR